MTSTMASVSSTNVTWTEGELFPWHAGEIVFISIMMIVGIIGNLLVFYIYHFRWRSNTVTLFKRMLAALDLTNLFFAMPSLLYITINPNSSMFMSTCVFTSFIALGTALASGSVLVIIAVDRYLKLCLLQKTGIGSQLSKKLFVASVVVACLENIPTGWIFGRDTIYFHHYHVRVSYCFIHTDSKSKTLFHLYAAMLGVNFLAISAVLVVLYYKIGNTLRSLSRKHDELKRRPSLGGPETLQKQKQSQIMRNQAVVFIAVTVVFFASYAPYFVTLILSMASPSVEGSMSPAIKALYDIAKLCPLFNNMANPFIYSFTSNHFRDEIKKMLTFKTCEKGFFRRRGLSISNKSAELSHFSDSREDE